MVQSILEIDVVGVRGGIPQTKQIGSVSAMIDNPVNEILIDAFSGYGETYMRRENSLINIYKDNEIVFSGTFDELCKKLQ